MLSNVMVAAVVASAPLAHAVGNAKVINACEYEVTLCNVPSSNGGYSEIDKTLSPNETYSQEWTQLSNGNGWSIKLSQSESLENILQYEYTYHNDGTIWYDLSEVNGNPWDQNWEITADGTDCAPKQQAYRYATDDAYGMQSCSDDAEITVTLCSGESQNDGAAEASSSVASTQTAAATASDSATSTYYSYSSEVAATSAPPPPPPVQSSYTQSSTPDAASTTSTPDYFYHHHHTSWNENVAAPATTLATSVATSVNDNGATVTNVETVVETAYATATVYAKRDETARRHRHPHARN